MRARSLIAAALTASVLLLTAACGSKDDTSDESKGSPAVSQSAEPAESMSAEPSADPSESASAEPSADSDGVTVTLKMVNKKPSKLPDDVKIKKGEKFTLIATSDKALEIHVHGFDKKLELEPGKKGTLTFTADKPAGSYVVEVEDTGFEMFKIIVK